MQKTIYVYENWSGDRPVKLGKLYVDQGRGSEHYAFEYDENWLTTSRFAYVLDPDLSLYKGRQYPLNKNTSGIFAANYGISRGSIKKMRPAFSSCSE